MKPTIPTFPDEPTPGPLHSTSAGPAQTGQPTNDGLDAEGFPLPYGPGGGSGEPDLAFQDGDNYAPSPELKQAIVCYGCKHFWLRKSPAVVWSTKSAANRRKEGRAVCLLTSPPMELHNDYVTDCNKFSPKETP